MTKTHIDLVLEGGGVKASAFVGALETLEQSGYTFRRVAGTSAATIVAALVAAGYTAADLKPLIHRFDYTAFADESTLDRFGVVGKSLSLLFEKGVYEGKYLHQLMTDLLAAKGIRTFGDLRMTSDNTRDITSRYKLVILAADITRGRFIRLPWDYHEYGLDPDAQPIADAIQASCALPFYFEPARLGKSYVVDGGVISSFPIWIFEGERHNHQKQWPTFGIKLSAEPEALSRHQHNDTSNTLAYAFSILHTLLSAQDQIHLNDPCTLRRTIFIDCGDTKSTEFDITPADKQRLYNAGIHATKKFLTTWDFEWFLRTCPARAQ